MIRFLVDECLSPMLVSVAAARGHDAVHAVAAGLAGRPDEELAHAAVQSTRALVTNNALDFTKLYARIAGRHPGLVVIGRISPGPVRSPVSRRCWPSWNRWTNLRASSSRSTPRCGCA